MIINTSNTRKRTNLLVSVFCCTKCTYSIKPQPSLHPSLVLMRLSLVKTRLKEFMIELFRDFRILSLKHGSFYFLTTSPCLGNFTYPVHNSLSTFVRTSVRQIARQIRIP